MARGLGDMLMILPLIFLMNQIDWTVEEHILYARIAYVVSQVVVLLIWVYVYFNISSIRNETKIQVPKAPTGFGTPSNETEETTVSEYDFAQWKKSIQQVVMGMVILGGIHYKFGVVQPLFMQCIMVPMQAFKSPLIQIFVLGKKGDIEKRPWIEENPFAALMPQVPENNTEAENNNNEAEVEPTSEENKKDQ